MTFKEYLISVGLSEEQANKTVEGMPANKLYISSEENLDSRYTKLKEQKEQLESDLSNATKLVDDLKKTNKDTEDLQKKITDYESQVEQLQTEREAERKDYAIKERLTKEGVTDIDYIKYKLGDVEMDKDGNLVDLDSKLKELKGSNPKFFASQDENKDNTNTNGTGYTPIDNKLDNGKQTDPAADATAAFEAALGIKSE